MKRRDRVKGSLLTEIRQSFYLLALMAGTVATYAGIGLLTFRVIG